jgi:hypothetical protein
MKMLSYFVILNCHFEKRGGLKKSRVLIQSDRASGFSEDPVSRGTFFVLFSLLYNLVRERNWAHPT